MNHPFTKSTVSFFSVVSPRFSRRMKIFRKRVFLVLSVES
jgi:hypothetical protein